MGVTISSLFSSNSLAGSPCSPPPRLESLYRVSASDPGPARQFQTHRRLVLFGGPASDGVYRVYKGEQDLLVRKIVVDWEIIRDTTGTTRRLTSSYVRITASLSPQQATAHKGSRDRGGRIRIVWPKNPTLPRLRRPAAPEPPQEGRDPSGATVAKIGSGSPRPASGRPAPRSGESRRGNLNRNNIIRRKSAQICTNGTGV